MQPGRHTPNRKNAAPLADMMQLQARRESATALCVAFCSHSLQSRNNNTAFWEKNSVIKSWEIIRLFGRRQRKVTDGV